MTKQQYKHFNPATYQIPVKIAKIRTSSHSKHNINYHIIWIPKYRKKVLYGKVADVLKQIITGQCQQLNLEMLALEVMPDHIHLFVEHSDIDVDIVKTQSKPAKKSKVKKNEKQS